MVLSFQFSYSLKVAGLDSNTLGRSSKGTSKKSFCNICKPTYSKALQVIFHILCKMKRRMNICIMKQVAQSFISVIDPSAVSECIFAPVLILISYCNVQKQCSRDHAPFLYSCLRNTNITVFSYVTSDASPLRLHTVHFSSIHCNSENADPCGTECIVLV